MTGICVKCGSMKWEEHLNHITKGYKVDEEGKVKEIYEENQGEVVMTSCYECRSDDTIFLGYRYPMGFNREFWKSLKEKDEYKQKGNSKVYRERLKLLLRKVIEKNEEWSEDITEFSIYNKLLKSCKEKDILEEMDMKVKKELTVNSL